MTQPLDAWARSLAAGQAGCLARWQLVPRGFTDRMITRRLANETWTRRHPGIYSMSGTPPSWEQDLWAATLAVGEKAVVTHETALLAQAAANDRLVSRHPIVLTAPHGTHHRVRDAVVHQLDDVRPHHLVDRAGLRVSTQARAIVDIAATGGERYVARLLDHLLVERHTSLAKVAACFREVLRPGKPGMAKLARVLDARGPGYIAAGSHLESRLLEALAAADLPVPHRQIPLPGNGEVQGCADVGYPDARLLVEADGRRWHTKVSDFARDRQRDVAAARAGWLTLRFSYEEITNDPQRVAASIAEVHRTRLREAIPEAIADRGAA